MSGLRIHNAVYLDTIRGAVPWDSPRRGWLY